MGKITTWGGPAHPADHEAVAAGPAESEAAVEASPPPVSAVKAEHVEYAVSELGVPQGEAESMTKPELVELARTDPDERPAPSLSKAKDE